MKNSKVLFITIVALICLIHIGTAQLAKGQSKWVGNLMGNYVPADFETYWNQVSLQWLGKWGQVQPTQTTWNWEFIDASYNYAKSKGFPYKQHTFIWRIEDPSWLTALSSAGRVQAIKTWMQTFCLRYPNVDFIDVVNEPLHEVPLYAGDLGGNGTTGWDWVITAFQYARQYCPNAKLLLNDYNIIAYDVSTTKYLEIVNLLKARNLIDGIGIQCHSLEGAGTTPILKNLYRLAETGLAVYVSQLDLFAADDNEQLVLYKKLFPLFYEHSGVKGVTLWGYRTGEFQMTISGLLNGTVERPALKWLRTEYFNSTVNKGPRAFWTTTASGLKVDFSASKSWDFDGTIASYSWALGDGSTSTSATPSKTYSVAGNYTVSLTVTDNQGLTNTFSDLLTVSGSSAVTTDWTKPIGYCKDKFVGSTIKNNYLSPNWDRYWNQATPEYLGKWTSVEATKDQIDWSGLDFAWNYTKQKGLLFKSHTLVWGQQIPSWVAGLSTADQALQVEQWIKLYCQRYPDYQLIDVVNEPIHETPNYINAIGGAGTTGWDWVVWSFQKARQYCPNAKLLINEYDVLNNDTNLAKYIQIINILKAKNLIDGVGEQGHHFETTTVTQLMNNLNTLAATSLPIYISELDLNLSDNTQHLNRMKQIVPMFYEHQAVKGITLWGYVKGETAQTGSWLYDSAASSGASTTTVTCATQNLQSNIPLALGVWNDYTVSIPTPGKIRAFFANDGATNSETMAVDYAIIDGVKYEAENQPINTAVWNGVSCGGQYSEMLHCSGYIEFPSGSSSVTIRAKAVDKGSQQLTIQLITNCTGGQSTVGLPQQRASLKWLKYEYLPTIASSTKPKAFFTSTISGMSVSFDASLSTDCDGTIVMYTWAFGDTLTGSGSKVSHIFAAAGNYTVQLTIFDNAGNGDIISQIITVGTVANAAPTAVLTSTLTGLKVDVSATGSTDTDGTIASYSWNWGDSTTAGTGLTSTHTYAQNGTYTIILTVTDDKGATGTVNKTVTVAKINTPPTATFVSTVSMLTVNFNATQSTDTDGTISTYAWAFGDGTTGSGVTVSKTYTSAGSYNVTLTVTDNSGATATSTQQVTVAATVTNNAPVALFDITSVKLLVVTVSASKSTDDTGIQSYTWTWGDGTTTTGVSRSKTYKKAGTFLITLTVKDLGGLSSSVSRNVTVKTTANIAPVCGISACGVWYYQVNCTSNSTDDLGINNYSWQWGDGLSNAGLSLQTGQHTYTAANTYTVTLAVTDTSGVSSSCTKSIVATTPANEAPVSVFGYWADSLYHVFWFEGWDSDGTVVSYLWNFGDGNTSTSNAPNYTFRARGTYNVTLTVTDDKGAKATSSRNVVVINIPKTFYIESMTKSVILVGSTYYGQLLVKVYDNTGSPLQNVAILGQVSNPASNLWDNVQATTNASGVATLVSMNGRTSLPYVDGCVFTLQYADGTTLWYNSADNKVASNCI